MFDAFTDAVSETLRNVTDLPGDVYGALAELPDSTSLSKRFRELGTDCLEVAIPVVRQVNSAAARMPYGSYLQPILLGKLFAVRDYVADRRAALEAIPELPGDLKKEAQSVSEFLKAHATETDAALEALPPLDQLRQLTTPKFWAEMWSAELEAQLAEIDQGYREVVTDPYRLEDELPVYRAVYAITYHALGSVDPITGALASLTPGAITTYQRFAARRAQLGKIVARLEDAGVDTGASAPAASAPAVEPAPPQPPDPVATEPAAPAPAPATPQAQAPQPTGPEPVALQSMAPQALAPQPVSVEPVVLEPPAEPTAPQPAALPALEPPRPQALPGPAAAPREAAPSALVPSGRLPAPLRGPAEAARQRVAEALRSSACKDAVEPIVRQADEPKLNALAIVVENAAPDLDTHAEVAEPMLAGKAGAILDYLKEREHFLEEAPGPVRAEVADTDAFFERHRAEIDDLAADVSAKVGPYMIDHWLRSIGEKWERFQSEIADHFPDTDEDRRALFYAFYSSAYVRLASIDDAKQALRVLDPTQLRRGRPFHDKHQLVDPVRFKLEMSSAWQTQR